MKYYIKRDLNEYGPYTLAELQRYVAQGNIALSDLTRSEGLTDWVRVSQVLGTIPVTPPAPVPSSVSAPATAPVAAGMVYGGAAPQPALSQVVPQVVPGTVPPDFHWALVLLIGFFCGLFTIVWLFIEAAFVKKLRPQSNSLAFLIGGISVQFGSMFTGWVGIVALAATGSNEPAPPLIPILVLALGGIAGVVLQFVGIFKMRSALEEYYNTVEPINLRLSGVMTFFFSVYYFQYHFTRIAEWKRTGVLAPQG
jgi:hypothetical protein